jgi:hypothetical protein
MLSAALRALPAGEESGGRPSPSGAVSMLIVPIGITPIVMCASGFIPEVAKMLATVPINPASATSTTFFAGSLAFRFRSAA